MRICCRNDFSRSFSCSSRVDPGERSRDRLKTSLRAKWTDCKSGEGRMHGAYVDKTEEIEDNWTYINVTKLHLHYPRDTSRAMYCLGSLGLHPLQAILASSPARALIHFPSVFTFLPSSPDVTRRSCVLAFDKVP
jgi:hypothetical protein